MRVEIAVPEVIDCAACPAHDERAGEEERRGTDDGERRRHRSGEWSGEQRREETWEEEVVGAGGLVKADELGVRDPGGGKMGEEASCRRRVCGRRADLKLLVLRTCL